MTSKNRKNIANNSAQSPIQNFDIWIFNAMTRVMNKQRTFKVVLKTVSSVLVSGNEEFKQRSPVTLWCGLQKEYFI